ncbi:MAG: YhbY family RNA-binding protein [Bacilli bacterium]|nr:YhbY family RNA-binding protein [Bacilli bacterium]
MLRPYQKAYLKSLANGISHRYLLGKEDPDAAFLDELDKALEARELIKVGLLQTAAVEAKDLAKELEEKLGAEAVQVIGRVIVLYRRSKKHPKIEIPTRKEDKKA